jgi:hypothetical protein
MPLPSGGLAYIDIVCMLEGSGRMRGGSRAAASIEEFVKRKLLDGKHGLACGGDFFG